ncbi:hypothetical protein A2U01_0082795, partial [Trifolium medium]|nr:hypothetical protein [Trifolium medium]
MFVDATSREVGNDLELVSSKAAFSVQSSSPSELKSRLGRTAA